MYPTTKIITRTTNWVEEVIEGDQFKDCSALLSKIHYDSGLNSNRERVGTMETVS